MLLFALLAGVPAAPAADAPKKVTSVEGVTEYRLDNGARVLLFPEASRPTVTVNMTVLVGSRHEGYGETGMAHLLEHMVFKGTPTFRDVPKALRDHGATFNGTTNDDRTNYFESMPSSDENLEFALKLEADRLVNSFIKREDLASEMTVVRNEFERGENDPNSILMQRIASAAYEWHNYGKSTIGNRSDIERVPIENLQAFYHKYYQPDNVVLIITGKFDETKALALVQKYVGALPKPSRKLDNTYTEEPPQDGERQVTLRRVGKVGVVGVAYHMPSAGHPDWAPLDILSDIMVQKPDGRLYKELVESKKATSVSAFAGDNHDPGLFVAISSASLGTSVDVVRDALLKTIEGLASAPITAAEVDRAKARNRRGYESLLSDSRSMAAQLSSASASGDWRLLFVQRDRLDAATVDDVNRVAKTYFQRPNRTVGVYIPVDKPERLAVGNAPSIESIVKDYKGGKQVAAGEAFEPTPENLDARTKVVDLGGVKAGLLTKKTRGETVWLALTLHYGNEESLRGQKAAADMLPQLMLAGTKKHDRKALQEELDSLGVRIYPLIAGTGRRAAAPPGELSFTVQAKRSTLPAALKLLGEILREPSFPPAEFDTLKARSKSAAEAMKTEPDRLAEVRIARALRPYPSEDIRHIPTAEETQKALEALTLPQVISLYEKQLGATEGEVAVVGDCDADATVAALREMLNGWKAEVTPRHIPREVPADFAAGKEVILTPDKANAVFRVAVPFKLKDSDPDYPALQLGNFLLGGGSLSSRLGNRIRQKEGLCYGVGSSMPASSRDAFGYFTAMAITNPLNIDKVEKAFAEELSKFIEGGPSASELEDARKAYLDAEKVGRTSDAAIAGEIVSNLRLGRTFAFAGDQEKKIAALTPDDIRTAFQKFVDPKKLLIIRAGDFKH
jgi:zinc protease